MHRILGLFKLCIYKIIYKNRIKFSIKICFNPKAKIVLRGKKSKITFHNHCLIEKDVSIVLSENATCIIEDGVKILENNYIQVGTNANMILGEKTFINRNCHIVAIKSLKIGKNVAMGNSISIFDHDHIVVSRGEQDWSKAKADDVIIGNNTWIASNVVILRGTHIGDNCVIGANTVVKGNIPDSTMCYNKKELVLKKIN